MKYPLTIVCPAMPVLNTSWLNPYADREAQQLVCDVLTTGPDGRPLPTFQIVFPKCRIRRVTDPKRVKAVQDEYNLIGVRVVWMVDEVTATSPIIQPIRITTTFPEEPTVRAPLWEGGNIDVLPVDSLGGVIKLPAHPVVGQFKVTLPRTTGRPVNFGLREYVVDAVECFGEVEWWIPNDGVYHG